MDCLHEPSVGVVSANGSRRYRDCQTLRTRELDDTLSLMGEVPVKKANTSISPHTYILHVQTTTQTLPCDNPMKQFCYPSSKKLSMQHAKSLCNGFRNASQFSEKLHALRIFIAALLFCCLPSAHASNWGQITGYNRQNIVTSSRSPWSRRWGFASTVIQKQEPTVGNRYVPPRRRSKLFIFGGDDYILPLEERQIDYGLDADGEIKDPNYPVNFSEYPDEGRGGLLNDIWFTTGRSYFTFNDYREMNPWGSPTPRLISNATWINPGDWAGFPPAVNTWKDYLACCHPSKPFPCGTPDLCLVYEADPYQGQRRWSPRRGHVAVTMYHKDNSPPTIILMGGRARSFQRMSGEELTGGFIGNPYDPGVTRRERTLLVNDVWVSHDEAMTWDFNNPGCFINQLEHLKEPGAQTQQCTTNNDCWKAGLGNAHCVPWRETDPTYRVCACKHWSPRERFSATAFNGTLYVTGGLTTTSEFKCGRFTCSRDYNTYLTDTWASDDLGVTWQLLSKMIFSTELYGRADHGMHYVGKLWFLFGGRGRDEHDITVDELYHNTYSSQDGEEWVLNATTSAWSPRAAFGTTSDGSIIYIFGGVEEVVIPPPDYLSLGPAEMVDRAASFAPTNVYREQEEEIVIPHPGEWNNNIYVNTLNDFWIYFGDDVSAFNSTVPNAKRNNWYKDFNNPDAFQYFYVHRHMPLTMPNGLFELSIEELDILENLGVTTLYELAYMNPETIEELLGEDHDHGSVDDLDGGVEDERLPDLCDYIVQARALLKHCDVQYRQHEGEWVGDLIVKDGRGMVEEEEDEPRDLCELVDPEEVVDEAALFEVICRIVPAARRDMALQIMDGLIYLAGGWEDNDYYANDFWYRDDVQPQAHIVHFPADMGSDTIISFGADELFVLYEAKFTQGDDEEDVIRDWHTITNPYDTKGINGKRKTRVMVRARDAAGNRGTNFTEGINVYVWTYHAPFPLLLTLLLILFFLLLLLALFLYYRHWKRRRAIDEHMRLLALRRQKELEELLKNVRQKRAFRTETRKRWKRAKAVNPLSEREADIKDRYSGLMATRLSRDRKARAQNIGATTEPITRSDKRWRVYGPREVQDVWNVVRRKTAKEAFEFENTDTMVEAKKGVEELNKIDRQYQVEAANAKKTFEERVRGTRKDTTTEKMRLAIHSQAELMATRSAGARIMTTLPPALLDKAAERKKRQTESDKDAPSPTVLTITPDKTERVGFGRRPSIGLSINPMNADTVEVRNPLPPVVETSKASREAFKPMVRKATVRHRPGEKYQGGIGTVHAKVALPGQVGENTPYKSRWTNKK